MSKAKRHHCFNCGADLGIYEAYYGDLQTCGAPECTRAERDAYREEDDNARYEAERDNYERYR